jgi:hypothetical protein
VVVAVVAGDLGVVAVAEEVLVGEAGEVVEGLAGGEDLRAA